MRQSSIAAIAALFVGALPALPAAAFDVPGWTSEHFRSNPQVGTIIAGDGSPRTAADLTAAIAAAEIVVAGETHDNPDHHVLQARILADMVAAGEHPAVVFEMIPNDFQPTVDAYLLRPDASAKGLGPAIEWEGRGWPDWTTYQPIAEVALSAKLAIRSGDLPRTVIRAVSKQGAAALSIEEAERFGLNRPLPEAFLSELTQTLEQSHCGMLPQQAIAPMLTVQRARDGALADATLRAAAEAGGSHALLIAGAGHARTDWGVPALIRARAPKAKVLSIGLVEVEADATAPDDADAKPTPSSPAPFDYLIFTPKADVSDPCQGMAEQMKTVKKTSSD